MNQKTLQQALSGVRDERLGGAPHEDWVSRNRDILMMQVRNTTERKADLSFVEGFRNMVSVFLPAERIAVATRTFAVFALVIGTVFGGGLTSVMAYRNAVPGDMTYGVKLAIERAQVSLAPNDAYRVRLHAEFADRRMDEAAKLAEGPEGGRRLAVGVLKSFSGELERLKEGLLSLKEEDPEGVALAAKLLDRKMASYQTVLRGIIRSLPSEIRPQAVAVAGRVDGLGMQAVAVLVEQHLSGDANASRETVSDRISDRISQAEARLSVARERAPSESSAKAQTAIAQAREMLNEENYQAAFSKMVEVVELADEMDDEEDLEEPSEPEPEPEEEDGEGEGDSDAEADLDPDETEE